MTVARSSETFVLVGIRGLPGHVVMLRPSAWARLRRRIVQWIARHGAEACLLASTLVAIALLLAALERAVNPTPVGLLLTP